MIHKSLDNNLNPQANNCFIYVSLIIIHTRTYCITILIIHNHYPSTQCHTTLYKKSSQLSLLLVRSRPWKFKNYRTIRVPRQHNNEPTFAVWHKTFMTQVWCICVTNTCLLAARDVFSIEYCNLISRLHENRVSRQQQLLQQLSFKLQHLYGTWQ